MPIIPKGKRFTIDQIKIITEIIEHQRKVQNHKVYRLFV